jgi:hypothetical protein
MFQQINHPAIKGYPHDYGTPHISFIQFWNFAAIGTWQDPQRKKLKPL